MPVFKKKNDKVHAGTTNKNGALIVRAEKVGDDTVISEIIRLVEQASGSKAKISRIADMISAYFVPVVIIISIITFIIWLSAGKGFEFAFSCAICVLVISCPCSLGLATPVAVTVGTGVAATHGILIKSAEKLEEIGKVDTILFDKTGTLTNGSPIVTDIIPSGEYSKEDFLKICASLEVLSEHPLGKAIVAKAKQENISLSPFENLQSLSGLGISASFNSKEYIGGNLSLLDKYGIKVDVQGLYEELSSQGKTPLFFAENGKYIGCIAVSDSPKSDSKKAIEKLSEMGISSVMLTGDNEITASAIAKEIGINEVFAGVSPKEKDSYVTKLKDSGRKVAMCGDGINDSPALARADVGISLSKGTDIAIESCDIILMHSDVYSVARVVALSRATISNIKLSLFWALFYNILGIPIAAGVLYPAFAITLNPMIGAAAMSLSSVCVVLNALRLRKFKFD